MSDTPDALPPSLDLTERVIGRHRGADSGPCLVVVAAQHGNEPAGVLRGGGRKGHGTALAFEHTKQKRSAYDSEVRLPTCRYALSQSRQAGLELSTLSAS